MPSLASANQSFGEPEDYSYGEWYVDGATSYGKAPQPKPIIPACYHTFPPILYHTCLASLSLATVLVLSLLVKRRKLCPKCWNGTFGLPSPVDFLATESGWLVPVVVFGILLTNLYMLFLDEDFSPGYLKTLGLLYYPALYYPLMACATVRHQAGYILGCLLSWVHCGVQIWYKVECPQTTKIYRYYSLLASLPLLAGLVFLSCWYPVQLLRSWTGKMAAHPEEVEESYYGDYLRRLLSEKKSKSSSPETNRSFLSRALLCLFPHISTRQPGFRFPLKLILSAAMTVITIYQVTLLLLAAFVPIIQKTRAGITIEVTYLLAGFGVVLSENKTEAIEVVKQYLLTVEVCYESAMTLSCLLTFFMLSKSLMTHRANLRAQQRAALLDGSPPPQEKGLRATTIFCWMSFTSYQTAFVCLGLFLQQIIFFFGFVVFSFWVFIPIVYGRNLLLLRVLESTWPFFLLLVLAVILQNLAARWAFLENRHGQQELTNKKALFAITFLLFLVNVMVGITVGICRMVVSALFNVVHFCQLDRSLLSRGVDIWDPGYRTYYYYLKMEVSQSHPIMKAFCFLLRQLPGSRGVAGSQAALGPSDIEGIHMTGTKSPAARAKQSRIRWGLAYTLIRNPSLLAFRKKALASPLANGSQPSPPKP